MKRSISSVLKMAFSICMFLVLSCVFVTQVRADDRNIASAQSEESYSMDFRSRKYKGKDIGGKSFDTAQKIPYEGTLTGVVENYRNRPQNMRYFSFTLTGERYMTAELVSQNNYKTEMSLYSKNSRLIPISELEAYHSTDKYAGLLEAGEYVLEVGCAGSGNDLAPYTINLGGRDYIPATGVELTCQQSKLTIDDGIIKEPKTFTFTASTIPANSDDKLREIIVEGSFRSGMYSFDGDIYGMNTANFTITYDGAGWPGYNPGYQKIGVMTENNLTSNKLEVVGKAEKPTGLVYESYYDKVFFKEVKGETYSASKMLRVYIKSGDKWVLKASRTNNEFFRITKLKANTAYKFKFVIAIPRSDGTWIDGTPLYKTIKTGCKQKPEVKSIRISDARIRTEGRWEWVNHSLVYRTYYYTDYKITVQLKKKLPGTLGILIDSHKVKGTGTTFTTKITRVGKKIGTTDSVVLKSYSMKGSTVGYGPLVVKKFVIR